MKTFLIEMNTVILLKYSKKGKQKCCDCPKKQHFCDMEKTKEMRYLCGEKNKKDKRKRSKKKKEKKKKKIYKRKRKPSRSTERISKNIETF